ncbi:MAG: hypothetical protein MR272_01235 [Pseudoflavonifractor sp.]|nr:hypothetical protein [Pseudoflavonifractor sp.]MDY3020259.1 hypothetical protein [Oscillospiraceae bacterium]
MLHCALPLYEPVLGGWFGEIGVIQPVLALTAILWLDAVDAYRFRLACESGYRQMERRLAVQKEHYRQLSEQVERARGASHDLRHHMRALRIMAGQGQMEQLLSYLENYESHMREHEVTTFSDHVAADAVLCYYADAVRLLGGIFDARLPLPPDLAFPDDELCILRTVRSCPQSEAVDSLCLFLRNGPPPRALFSFFPKTLISG